MRLGFAGIAAVLGLLVFEAACLAGADFESVAHELLIDEPGLHKKAGERIREIAGWKERALKLVVDPKPARRALAANLLTLDPNDARLASAFVTLLEDKSPEVRQVAADLVSSWKGSGRYASMRKALLRNFSKSRNNIEKFVIITSVAEGAESDSFEVLTAATRDASAEVRTAAVHGLGNLTVDPKRPVAKLAIKELIRVAREGEMAEKLAAIYYVKRSGGADGRALVAKVATVDSSQDVRDVAASLMGEDAP